MLFARFILSSKEGMTRLALVREFFFAEMVRFSEYTDTSDERRNDDRIIELDTEGA